RHTRSTRDWSSDVCSSDLDKAITERLLTVLRPYASNWSGTLSRGDLVIPQAEVPRLIREIAGAVQEIVERHGEAADLDVFQALRSEEHTSELQSRVDIVCR